MQSSSGHGSVCHSNGHGTIRDGHIRAPKIPCSIVVRLEAIVFPVVTLKMLSEQNRAAAENSLAQLTSPSLRSGFQVTLAGEEEKFLKLSMEPKMLESFLGPYFCTSGTP